MSLAPPPVSATRRRWVLASGVGAAGVVIVVLGFVAGTRSGDPSSTTRASAPPMSASLPLRPGATGTFDVYGTLEVDSAPGQPVSGDARSCTLPPQLSDLGPGTRVVLGDSSRRTVSTAMLSYDSGTTDSCQFSFTLTSVPAGQRSYTLSVAHRGGVQYSEKELREGVAVTLGD